MKKSLDSAVTHAWLQMVAARDNFTLKSKIMANQQLAEELQKPIIRKTKGKLIL